MQREGLATCKIAVLGTPSGRQSAASPKPTAVGFILLDLKDTAQHPGRLRWSALRGQRASRTEPHRPPPQLLLSSHLDRHEGASAQRLAERITEAARTVDLSRLPRATYHIDRPDDEEAEEVDRRHLGGSKYDQAPDIQDVQRDLESLLARTLAGIDAHRSRFDLGSVKYLSVDHREVKDNDKDDLEEKEGPAEPRSTSTLTSPKEVQKHEKGDEYGPTPTSATEAVPLVRSTPQVRPGTSRLSAATSPPASSTRSSLTAVATLLEQEMRAGDDQEPTGSTTRTKSTTAAAATTPTRTSTSTSRLPQHTWRLALELRSLRAGRRLPLSTVRAVVAAKFPDAWAQLVGRSQGGRLPAMRTFPPLDVNRGSEGVLQNGFAELRFIATARDVAAALRSNPKVTNHASYTT